MLPNSSKLKRKIKLLEISREIFHFITYKLGYPAKKVPSYLKLFIRSYLYEGGDFRMCWTLKSYGFICLMVGYLLPAGWRKHCLSPQPNTHFTAAFGGLKTDHKANARWHKTLSRFWSTYTQNLGHLCGMVRLWKSNKQTHKQTEKHLKLLVRFQSFQSTTCVRTPT